MPKIIPRYLFVQTLRGVGLALSVVLVLILLVDFVEQTRNIDTPGLQLWDFAGLTLLKTPMLVETTLPFIVLFGVMLAMFRLNRRSELVVMRASGLSVWRFVTPALLVAVLAGMLSATALNPLATSMTQRFEAARTALTGGVEPPATAAERMAWFREIGGGEQRMIRAENADPVALTLERVTFLFYDAPPDVPPEFTRRIDADGARYEDGVWRLEGAVESSPNTPARALGAIGFPAYLDVAAFGQSARAQDIPFWELRAAARTARDVGVSPVPYELRWMRLAMSPVLFAAMALIASAVSLRLVRLGGALQLVVLGGAAGFALYFVGNMLEAFALGGQLPPAAAAVATPAVAALAALAAIAHMEDAG